MDDTVEVNSDAGTYRLHVLPKDHISGIIRRTGRPYEEDLLSVISSFLGLGDVVVDVGANIGNHTIYWANRGFDVVAFEPYEDTRRVLERSIDLNGLGNRVSLRSEALGAFPGRARARQATSGNLGSVVIERVDGLEGEIGIVPLDALHLPRFHAVKIDVEGAEADVVRGAERSIRRWRPIVAMEASGNQDEAERLLERMGYRRVPSSFGITPVVLYVPRLRDLFRPFVLREIVVPRLRSLARRLGVSGPR